MSLGSAFGHYGKGIGAWSKKEMAGKIADGLEKIDPYADKVAKAITSPLAKKIGVGAAITAGIGATAYGIHSAYDYLDKKF